ncbi:flagellar assembly protein FliH [Sporolituus thermophilus]|uniref:Flagellar assembly protein FliH n=1 Tax=Sporolituus thermophilus DSM 23256 TaxID=1123285 RepID=A0A1G7KP32_9FIRM|nr:flagellar assembly protein FliH [Sporolituus thermophilus]SDF38891.1 flagellar assembly protein FliH [Sporolituus thermophilus DSM 23256]
MSKIIKYVRVQGTPVVIEPVHTIEQTEVVKDSLAGVHDEIIADAEKEAARLLSEARKNAAALLNEARQQYEKLKKEAFDQGYQAGYSQGMQQGRQDIEAERQNALRQAADQAGQLLAAARREYQQTLIDAERHIIDLALAVARKILAREIEENPMVVLPIVRAALEKVRDQEQITILVNPEDFEVVLEAKRDLELVIGRERALQIIADNTVGRGGCLLDTPFGMVDARIDTQFEMVKRALEDLLP